MQTSISGRYQALIFSLSDCNSLRFRRHETTVIERSGSRLILQEVKQLQDADEQDHAGLPKRLTPSQDLMRYRRVQRVASVPMLLDAAGPLRRPAADIAGLRDAEIDPELAQELNQPLPGSRLQGTATTTKRREPPKRRESLKCLLKLDQYHFNEDVSTLDAVEALGFQPGDENTSVETTVGSAQDILTADGRSSVLLAASPALPQSMRRLKWTIEDYQLIKQLHKGYASDVYQVRPMRHARHMQAIVLMPLLMAFRQWWWGE